MLDRGSVEIDLTLTDAIGHAVLWVIVSIVTLGIGLFFFPYAFAKYILNRMYILDGDGKRIGRLRCDVDIASQLGHIILWLILAVVTLGLAYVVYVYRVWTFTLNKTQVEAP